MKLGRLNHVGIAVACLAFLGQSACSKVEAVPIRKIVSAEYKSDDPLKNYANRLRQISSNPIVFFAELDDAGFEDSEPTKSCSTLKLPNKRGEAAAGYRAFVQFCQKPNGQIRVLRMGLGSFSETEINS